MPVLSLLQPLRRWRKARRFVSSWTDEDQRRFEFYGRLIAPGTTVFDVGANMGNRTKVFLRLNANVVAFEPQRQCAEYLEFSLRRHPRAKLVRKALGAASGTSKMFVSDTHVLSSLSRDWIDATQTSGRFSNHAWNKTQSVEIATLDEMIQTYGCPSFIKIDVEGYEYEVLRGLSTPVDFLSIEFTPEYLDDTLACITHVSTIAKFKFQLSIGESMKFHLDGWVAADQVSETLKQLESAVFGDVYMKRV